MKGGQGAPLSRAVGNFFDEIEKVLQAVEKVLGLFRQPEQGPSRPLGRGGPCFCLHPKKKLRYVYEKISGVTLAEGRGMDGIPFP